MDRAAAIRQHQGLVYNLANLALRKLPANVERDDLVQAGMMALLSAYDRFDASLGVQFSTFASPRIRGAMLDELRGDDWLGRNDRSQTRRTESATRMLQHRLLRRPIQAEIALELGLSLADFQKLPTTTYPTSFVNIDDLPHRHSQDDYLDHHDALPADEDQDPAQILEAAQTRQQQTAALAFAVTRLSDRQRRQLGLSLLEGATGEHTAKVLGVSGASVSAMHSVTLALLRKDMRCYGAPPGAATKARAAPTAASWLGANIKGMDSIELADLLPRE